MKRPANSIAKFWPKAKSSWRQISILADVFSILTSRRMSTRNKMMTLAPLELSRRQLLHASLLSGLALASNRLTNLAFGAEESLPPHADLSWYPDANGNPVRPIKTKSDWEKRRALIQKNIALVMGKLQKLDPAVPLAMEVLETKKEEYGTRQKIRYQTDHADHWVHAHLFQPSKPGKQAAILCLHQTNNVGKDEPAGLGGKPSLHYAMELAQQGFVTLAPDYPSFGEYQYEFTDPRYISGSLKAVFDNIRAIDLLVGLPSVNAKQIGCIGHSLGGHNTIFTMVHDERIQAGVSCCGFTRFHKYYEGDLKGWTSPRYMPLINDVYNNDANKVPFDFPELLACLVPRAFLTVSPTHDDNFEVSGVKDSIASAKPIFDLLKVGDKLQAIYPEAEHDFPEESRKIAYAFLKTKLESVL